MLVKSLKFLLLLKPYSAKKQVSSSHIGLFLMLWEQKDTSSLRFGIVLVPETEQPSLVPAVWWAERLSPGAAETLLGGLNVRSGKKLL